MTTSNDLYDNFYSTGGSDVATITEEAGKSITEQTALTKSNTLGKE